jgi:hypothetical protein
MCTFEPVKLVRQGQEVVALREKQVCQCVYFCTSKASKAGTGGGGAQREAGVSVCVLLYQ